MLSESSIQQQSVLNHNMFKDERNKNRSFIEVSIEKICDCTVICRTSLTASRNSLTISPKLSSPSEGISHAAARDGRDEGGVWLHLGYYYLYQARTGLLLCVP